MSCWTARSAVGNGGGVLAVAGLAMLVAAGSTAREIPLAPVLPDSLAGAPQAQQADAVPAMVDDAPAVSPPDSLPPAPSALPVPDFFDTGVSGTAAVLMTPVFPGWGQLYAGNSWRAMLAFGAQWYFWSNMLARDRQAVRYRDHGRTLPDDSARGLYESFSTEYWEQMRDLAWWSGAVMLIIALDAYVGTGLYAFEQEPLPVPGRFDEFFDLGMPEPVGSRGAPLLVIWQWSGRF